MDSDEGKLFVGGIAWDTTEDKLVEYFGKYGDVTQATVMRDRATGRPRGFAFVAFADSSAPDRVAQEKHVIDGKAVDAKRAISREQQQVSKPEHYNSGKGLGEDMGLKTKKIFVGGLPTTLTEEGFLEYFKRYGRVTDVVIMYDQNTQRPRGFGFVSFDSEDAVDNVLGKTFHELSGKLVEVKRALPKDANPGGGGRNGSYHACGGSEVSAGVFSNQMDGSRYLNTQHAPINYAVYPGYIGPAYGYGLVNNNFPGSGMYGGYGIGCYGPSTAGFSGPVGAFGSPNVLGTGYLSGPPSPLSTPWRWLTPSYGASAYWPIAGYGASSPWNGAGRSVASAQFSQFLGGTSAYETQGYHSGNLDRSGKSGSNSGKKGIFNLHSGSFSDGDAGANATKAEGIAKNS